MSSPLLVVGSFVQDLTFFVERLPAVGETVVGRFISGPGGKGSNQAVAAKRAGVATAFVGAVGYDTFGDEANAFLEAEGIEHRLLRIGAASTGTAGIVVNQAGQNNIVVALGASEKFSAIEVDAALLDDAKILVVQFEIQQQTVHDLLALAYKMGKITILNPAPMIPHMDFSMLSFVRVFIPNETEFVTVIQQHPATRDATFTEEKLHLLAQEKLHELCRKLRVPTIIVTLGKRGCFVSQMDGFEEIPACSGLSIVDTTGAGDAFVGGFAAGLIQFNGDIRQAAHFGNIVAGLSVTKRGTAPAMPKKAEIEAFIAAQSHADLS